ncbi:prepilin-type N-terminal cleavage/methylation domain-containing protein [Candidatus Daviesbacteria bacterium]|nr:prepilin-type N-terminal cleavage/methylation domain-containing protein [Candidatus Daviesbacteria bacterium]
MYSEKGQSLMELVVVVAVIAVVVGALVFATIASLRNASFAKNQAQATKLAQEGIERVRSGRDRNQQINCPFCTPSVVSWNGDDSGNGSIWNYQINSNCGNLAATPPLYCYFNVTNQGALNHLIAASDIPSGAEGIPAADPVFRRVVIISDDANFATQKEVTVIVRWTDFSGSHESRLTTYLRKVQ